MSKTSSFTVIKNPLSFSSLSFPVPSDTMRRFPLCAIPNVHKDTVYIAANDNIVLWKNTDDFRYDRMDTLAGINAFRALNSLRPKNACRNHHWRHLAYALLHLLPLCFFGHGSGISPALSSIRFRASFAGFFTTPSSAMELSRKVAISSTTLLFRFVSMIA